MKGSICCASQRVAWYNREFFREPGNHGEEIGQMFKTFLINLHYQLLHWVGFSHLNFQSRAPSERSISLLLLQFSPCNLNISKNDGLSYLRKSYTKFWLLKA